ncbi:MAG: hypothetical protein ACI4SG_08665 [Oligosphaeraceae bacterium]
MKILKPVMDGEMGEDAEALGEYLEICGVKLARQEDALYFARLARQELDNDASALRRSLCPVDTLLWGDDP